jgi:hypothetical protein
MLACAASGRDEDGHRKEMCGAIQQCMATAQTVAHAREQVGRMLMALQKLHSELSKSARLMFD